MSKNLNTANPPQLTRDELRERIERCLPDLPAHARPYAVDAIMAAVDAYKASNLILTK